MTQSGRMRLIAVFLMSMIAIPVWSQTEEYRVYTERPRLLLTKQRLRLLKRERERQTPRWEQWNTLVSGKAQFAEQGFTLALYHQVTGDAAYGKQAAQWAVTQAGQPNGDVRQIAIVYDWCAGAFTESQSKAVVDRLKRAIAVNDASGDLTAWRARALAAIAIADEAPAESERLLKTMVTGWWRGRIAPALERGERPVARTEHYALMELLHALRDNLTIDLREDARGFFKDLPAVQLLTYYPQVFQAPENEYRIPIYTGGGDPDVRVAVLSRAAELAMVAFDNNALDSQFLQGWLMDEHFVMRGVSGATYEFLWANPYQPGLSYYKFPLSFHNPTTGELFLRSSWDDDAKWIGLVGGKLQFADTGKLQAVAPSALRQSLTLGESMVTTGTLNKRVMMPDGVKQFYVVGLKAGRAYQLEIDDEEMAEFTADAMGTVSFTVVPRPETGYILREAQGTT